ncbi:hypothetical protein BBP40_001446 [Aspergillus hancockii]|nr:hypothetical protein BBP40_001446 [Aspergillus hancockii]
MVYHTAVILLTRPYQEDQRSPNSPNSLHLPQQSSDNIAQKASILHLEAAKHVCALGEQYRVVFGSFRQNPITATYCTLSAALALLNPSSQGTQDAPRNDIDKGNVESGLKMLELSHAWWPAGKYHCSLLHMIYGENVSEYTAGSAKGKVVFDKDQYTSQTPDQNPIGVTEGLAWGQPNGEFDWPIWAGSALATDSFIPSRQMPGLLDGLTWLHEETDNNINSFLWEQN